MPDERRQDVAIWLILFGLYQPCWRLQLLVKWGELKWVGSNVYIHALGLWQGQFIYVGDDAGLERQIAELGSGDAWVDKASSLGFDGEAQDDGPFQSSAAPQCIGVALSERVFDGLHLCRDIAAEVFAESTTTGGGAKCQSCRS